MPNTRPLTVAIAAAWLACAALSAHAQTAAPKPVAKPAAKAPAAKKPAKAKKAPVEAPLAAADAEQMQAASMAHVGAYQCEFNQVVNVAQSTKAEGYVDVNFGKLNYTMKPVLSSTGALRLEDVKGQTMMLQIAHKSMLMDVKAGRRLVDECMHEKQAAAKKQYESQAAPSLMGSPDPAAAPR